MSEYWRSQISDNYLCANCGGNVRKNGSAPIARGYICNYKCIRCSNDSRMKYKTVYDQPKIYSDLIRK